MFLSRSISLTALILSAPCSALAQTILYAGASGALVCDTPKPLKVYEQLFNDAKARAKYLTSESVASCQRVPKDTAYLSVEPITPHSGEIVHLRSKEDAKNVYVLRREWLTGISSTELASIVQAIRACVQPKWKVPKNVKSAPDDVVKLRLRFNRDGTLVNAPTIATPDSNHTAKTISDAAIKAIRACEPFKLPADKYDVWKDVVLYFSSRTSQSSTKSKLQGPWGLLATPSTVVVLSLPEASPDHDPALGQCWRLSHAAVISIVRCEFSHCAPAPGALASLRRLKKASLVAVSGAGEAKLLRLPRGAAHKTRRCAGAGVKRHDVGLAWISTERD